MPDDANVTTEGNEVPAGAEGQVTDKGTSGDDTTSVDQLLSEFDQDTGASDGASPDNTGGEGLDGAKATETTPGDIDSNPEFLEMKRQFDADRQARTSKDLDKAAKTLQGSHDALSNVPERVLRGVLQDKAGDKRFVQAFINRERQPETWGKLLKALGRELGKEFKAAPDKNLSDNMSSLRSAVNSTDGSKQTDGPTQSEIARMSDQEFHDYKAKHGLVDASGWG